MLASVAAGRHANHRDPRSEEVGWRNPSLYCMLREHNHSFSRLLPLKIDMAEYCLSATTELAESSPHSSDWGKIKNILVYFLPATDRFAGLPLNNFTHWKWKDDFGFLVRQQASSLGRMNPLHNRPNSAQVEYNQEAVYISWYSSLS